MTTTLMDLLYHLDNSPPVDFTYMGIGSAPHLLTLETYTTRWQQIVPPFLQDDYISHPSKTFRLLHFDPTFAGNQQFLQQYFEQLGWGLVSNLQEETPKSWYCIRNHRLEILLIPEFFYHARNHSTDEHSWFLEHLIEKTLTTRDRKLLVQEYTGDSTDLLCKSLVGQYNPQRFRKQILFDISYGTDTGCCTNLDICKPFYDASGSFLNLTLMSHQELLPLLGQSPDMDVILYQKLHAEFLSILNAYHVDYRRMLVGDPPFQQTHEYNQTTAPSEIMRLLQEKLRAFIPHLRKLGLLTQESERELDRLFVTYQTYNPYTWYTCVSNCLKLNREEPPSPAQPQ